MSATSPSPSAPSGGERVRVLGAFCWHELHTRDRARAAEFYTRLIGWGTVGEGWYTEWVARSGIRVGGMMAMPPSAPEDVPSHWAVYVNVADVDASARRAIELGGRLLSPPMDIPEIGRISTVADPSGAAIQLFTGVNDCGVAKPDAGPGQFCWTELLTHDPERANAFYGGLFGWTTSTMPWRDGVYTLYWRPDAKPEERIGCVGGMMPILPEWGPMPSVWLSYIQVENVDETASRIVPLGGTVLCPPTDIPGVGRFAVGCDPTGASFALYLATR